MSLCGIDRSLCLCCVKIKSLARKIDAGCVAQVVSYLRGLELEMGLILNFSSVGQGLTVESECYEDNDSEQPVGRIENISSLYRSTGVEAALVVQRGHWNLSEEERIAKDFPGRLVFFNFD